MGHQALTTRAPWRSLFLSHMSRKAPFAEFSLSTVSHDSKGKAYPRVRLCIFRGFWAEIDQYLHSSAKRDLEEAWKQRKVLQAGATAAQIETAQPNEGVENGTNPGIYESDLLTFTTDVRMDKVAEITSTDEDGTGGDVEALFWNKESMTQWRVRGKAFVIGGNDLKAEEEIRKWMRRRGGILDETWYQKMERIWNWEWEVTSQFANLSPLMRGSFKNPPPGTPVTTAVQDQKLRRGQRVHDLNDPIARQNFRVVVIRPVEVELVDLTNPEAGKRVRWVIVDGKDGQSGERPQGGVRQHHWIETDIWP